MFLYQSIDWNCVPQRWICLCCWKAWGWSSEKWKPAGCASWCWSRLPGLLPLQPLTRPPFDKFGEKRSKSKNTIQNLLEQEVMFSVSGSPHNIRKLFSLLLELLNLRKRMFLLTLWKLHLKKTKKHFQTSNLWQQNLGTMRLSYNEGVSHCTF